MKEKNFKLIVWYHGNVVERANKLTLDDIKEIARGFHVVKFTVKRGKRLLYPSDFPVYATPYLEDNILELIPLQYERELVKPNSGSPDP